MIIQTDVSTKCWGAYCKGVSTGAMVKGGKAFSHKCSGITHIKICNPIFHKEFITLDNTCSSRQQSCSCISLEAGWYPQSTVCKNQQVNLKLSPISSDHNDCREPSKKVECKSTLGVQECSRLIRLETSSESLSENNQTLRNPNSRFVCLQAKSPTFPIYDMEARYKQFCNRCNASGLEQNVWLCIPNLHLDRSSDKQGSPGKCRSNDTSDTHMADTNLVYSPTKNVHTTSIAFSSSPKHITESPGRKHPLVKVSGVEDYRKILEIERILSSAANFISMFRRLDSIIGYESAWNKWVSWCCRQQIDPVCAT